LSWQGKQFSADAFLEGLRKIKDETDKKQALNRALIPMLQNISPGKSSTPRMRCSLPAPSSLTGS
jgi:hypothetical protein